MSPNHQLRASDFPLHKVADPTDRESDVLRDVDDVVSSQGVHLRQFVRAERGAIKDVTVPVADPVFNIDGINTRRPAMRKRACCVRPGSTTSRRSWSASTTPA